MNTRTHIVIPQKLVAQIDRLVGKRGRSHFITEAATKELMRRRQLAALRQAAGAWGQEDHPELKGGVVAYVKNLRREGDSRLRKQARRG